MKLLLMLKMKVGEKIRLIKRLGVLDTVKMEDVDTAIQISLGLVKLE